MLLARSRGILVTSAIWVGREMLRDVVEYSREYSLDRRRHARSYMGFHRKDATGKLRAKLRRANDRSRKVRSGWVAHHALSLGSLWLCTEFGFEFLIALPSCALTHIWWSPLCAKQANGIHDLLLGS